MRSSRSFKWVSIAAAVLCTACGGGGGVNSTPTPVATGPQPPVPGSNNPGGIPPSPPPPTKGLVDPTQTSSPADVLAAANSSFANGAPGTTFPLLLTAVGPAFDGDTATTVAGGTLQLTSAGATLTLNNSSAGVTGAAPNAYPYNQNFYQPDGRPVVALVGANESLDYTRFGYWTEPTSINPYYDRGGGAWLTGYVTPASQIPTSGTANYSGRVVGIASSYPVCACDDFKDFTGKVQMSADFGARAISGSMTKLTFTDMEFDMIPLNDVGFAATFDGSGNFNGSTSVLTVPFNPYPGFDFAVEANGSGTIRGKFYGPSAREVGAVWTLSDGTHRLIGSFGAKKGP